MSRPMKARISPLVCSPAAEPVGLRLCARNEVRSGRGRLRIGEGGGELPRVRGASVSVEGERKQVAEREECARWSHSHAGIDMREPKEPPEVGDEFNRESYASPPSRRLCASISMETHLDVSTRLVPVAATRAELRPAYLRDDARDLQSLGGQRMITAANWQPGITYPRLDEAATKTAKVSALSHHAGILASPYQPGPLFNAITHQFKGI
ncbi:hypothetical protein K438DRAFT_1946125 [Mycena galopus ATCC 62051]|nr:hypothetical protein K438DRAFT_1946125 [Mycena galopus ATCC 62051]